mgnify:CR=1 FL=1
MKTSYALGYLQIGNPRDLEAIISFLQRDEYRHRSGYAKEYAWRRVDKSAVDRTAEGAPPKRGPGISEKENAKGFWCICAASFAALPILSSGIACRS